LLPVVQDVNKRGWLSKEWKTKSGLLRGGKPFDKCSIYTLLTNPLYAGLIRHKDVIHKGEHEPIIDAPMFDAVQKQLKTNGRGRGNQLINKHGAILKGILRCSACDHAMVHTFTRKKEKIYRYYSCTHAIKSGRDACPTPNLPAAEIEQAVLDQIRSIGADAEIQNLVIAQIQSGQNKQIEELETNRQQLQRQLSRDHAELGKLAILNDPTGATSARIADLHTRIAKCEADLARVVSALTSVENCTFDRVAAAESVRDFDEIWNALTSREKGRLIRLVVSKIEFSAENSSISVSFYPDAIRSLQGTRKEVSA
jgi:site-specific DNA recombinase